MNYEENARRLIALREEALNRWDATAYNDYDRQVRANLAAMNAEYRAGLRNDPIITVSV